MSTLDNFVASFLEFACWDHHVHGRGDYRMTEAAAMRILRKHPDIARDSLYTAVVCGDLEEVEGILAARPELANQKGGPRGWEPILYLTYARLPTPAARDNAIPIARALLDRGANPNAYYMAGDAVYSALTGVAGEGEQDAPPHPQREALYRFLLERGAGPYDIQVLYNTHFRGDVLWWLELTYAQAVKAGRKADWDDPDWPMFDMGGYGSGARFLLWVAIDKSRDVKLAEWLLSHGANPDAAPAHDRRLPKGSLYEDALRYGHPDIAELLVRYGARRTEPAQDDEEAFVRACFNVDRGPVETLLARHPAYRTSTKALFAAAKHDRADALALLLDAGVSSELEDARRQRALHVAAGANALDAAAFLVERGANIDPRDAVHNNTPLGYAVHYWHRPMIDLLAPHSRDVWNLAYIGDVARLRAVVAAEPRLATQISPRGITPLWWLPDDEAAAAEIVDLFLSNGADPSVKARDGSTAADYARKRGLEEAANKLDAFRRDHDS